MTSTDLIAVGILVVIGALVIRFLTTSILDYFKLKLKANAELEESQYMRSREAEANIAMLHALSAGSYTDIIATLVAYDGLFSLPQVEAINTILEDIEIQNGDEGDEEDEDKEDGQDSRN